MSDAEISITKRERKEAKREISTDDAIEIVKKLDEQSGWKIFKLIEYLTTGLADSVSVGKDDPHMRLYMSKHSFTNSIAIDIEKDDKEIELDIPTWALEKVVRERK